jgi:pSer/pThr/pTyr-binding forkhead associated (FHA) protein
MDLPQLLALARRVGREEFVQRFDHPFLSRPRLSFTSFGQDEPGVVTDVRPFDGDAMRPATVRFVPLVRKESSPYSDRITVGRTANCDVVLQDRSVSKLHALFWPADDLDGWGVSDARSANGTWLNERRLAPLDRMPIKPGDLVRLGQLEVKFIDPSMLYELLVRRLPRTLPPR